MTDKLLQRAKELQTEFDVLDSDLTSAASSSDLDKVKELSQRRSVLEKIVESGNKYAHFVEELADVEDLLSSEDDAEILEMAQEDKTRLNEEIEEAKEAFRRCLLPPDPHDNKNILIEIRAGTGGDEAGLFASDLFKMYSRYAEKIGLKVEIMNANTTGVGGLKEIVFSIEGQGTYSNFKYESGVHRVQRVPETEASGRIHTSAATVAVLPEPDEVDVDIDQGDLTIDVYRSSGPGGQSVNTTDSAVRIVFKKGTSDEITVSCQDEKSQIKNRAKAMRVLRARLLEAEEKKLNDERADVRRNMVGSGDRSAKIRTYNFPQGRCTDHRIELTLYALDSILNGDLEKVIEPMRLADEEMRLSDAESRIGS